MTVHDTYRVVYTAPDGCEVAGNLLERDLALGLFTALLQTASPVPRRLRVISEKVWLESVDASLAEGWNFVADEMDAGRWKA